MDLNLNHNSIIKYITEIETEIACDSLYQPIRHFVLILVFDTSGLYIIFHYFSFFFSVHR